MAKCLTNFPRWTYQRIIYEVVNNLLEVRFCSGALRLNSELNGCGGVQYEMPGGQSTREGSSGGPVRGSKYRAKHDWFNTLLLSNNILETKQFYSAVDAPLASQCDGLVSYLKPYYLKSSH